jgi:hypothetical protein
MQPMPTAGTLIIESPADCRDSFTIKVDERFGYTLFPITIINLPVNCVSKRTNKRNVYASQKHE